MSRPPSWQSRVTWFCALTRRAACRSCSACTPRSRRGPASRRSANGTTSATARGALIASLAVPTGEVVWDVGPTRTNDDFAAHLLHTLGHFAGWKELTWVVDNLNTHFSLQACEVLAAVNGRPFWPRALRTGLQRRAFLTDAGYPFRLVYLPRHGSWLNQVELFFSVLARRWLKRGDFASAAVFEARLGAFLEDYNARHAHPYRWTYTGQPLVRGTPFSQTRAQQQRGRAWFGSHRQRFQRLPVSATSLRAPRSMTGEGLPKWTSSCRRSMKGPDRSRLQRTHLDRVGDAAPATLVLASSIALSVRMLKTLGALCSICPRRNFLGIPVHMR